MIVAVPKETHAGEKRVAMTPDGVKKLVAMGAVVEVESGVGETVRFSDQNYVDAGATVASSRDDLLAKADLVLRLRKPDADELAKLKKDAIHVSYLDPFNERSLVDQLASAGLSALSMEMIPRTTLAQKMDALSSQASLAGYAAVVIAAERLDRVFPMMMTPAGTITPANVFILGAGVAGLQAIATAKRMGARVTAFDIRPSSQTEVESLGAKFLKIDLGETGQTKDGYAQELTDEQKKLQQEGQTKAILNSDVVITTAQLFGRKAPTLIKREVVDQMKPGSVIVDMAVDSGGNVEGSEPDKEVTLGGVRIIGMGNLPGEVAFHASQMYASNLNNLIAHFWDKEASAFVLNRDDDIMKSALITHDGQIVNERIKSFYEGK